MLTFGKNRGTADFIKSTRSVNSFNGDYLFIPDPKVRPLMSSSPSFDRSHIQWSHF